MDQFIRLPKVLRNEIYEFARGDRAYWKRQFNVVVVEAEYGQKNLSFLRTVRGLNSSYAYFSLSRPIVSIGTCILDRDVQHFNGWSVIDEDFNMEEFDSLDDARRAFFQIIIRLATEEATRRRIPNK